jgi:hypothetical protein
MQFSPHWDIGIDRTEERVRGQIVRLLLTTGYERYSLRSIRSPNLSSLRPRGTPCCGVRYGVIDALAFGVHFDRRDEAAIAQQCPFYLADLQFRVATAQALLNHDLLGVVSPALGGDPAVLRLACRSRARSAPHRNGCQEKYDPRKTTAGRHDRDNGSCKRIGSDRVHNRCCCQPTTFLDAQHAP